jgi:hypothetical protein
MVFALDIGNSVQQAFNNFFAWLPNLIGAIVIVLVGWLIARLVAALIRRGMRALNADRAVETGSVGKYKNSVAPDLKASDLVATIAFWFVLGIAVLLALSALKIPMLGAAIGQVVGYLPNVIAAILILIVGVAIAGAVGALSQRFAGDTMLGRIVQTAVPIVVLSLTIAMALVELQIAPSIVLATYVIVLGSIGLGLALAFGLGGREVASTMLRSGYENARESMPQMQAEAQIAADRAKGDTSRVKQEVDQKVEEREPGAVSASQPTEETVEQDRPWTDWEEDQRKSA